jgi:hypothetical protein
VTTVCRKTLCKSSFMKLCSLSLRYLGRVSGYLIKLNNQNDKKKATVNDNVNFISTICKWHRHFFKS